MLDICDRRQRRRRQCVQRPINVIHIHVPSRSSFITHRMITPLMTNAVVLAAGAMFLEGQVRGRRIIIGSTLETTP